MKKYLLLLLSVTILHFFPQSSAATRIVLPPSRSLDSSTRAVVLAAVEAFKSLPGRERKAKLKEAKAEIKKFRAARKAGMETDTNLLILVVLAILLPPVAVYLHEGETNSRFWISLLLFIAGLAGFFFFSHWLILAAIVYALIVVLGGA